MKKRRRNAIHRACWSFALVSLCGSAVRADDFTWVGTSSQGDWNLPNNWTGGITADFPHASDNANLIAPSHVDLYLQGDQAVNALNFGDSNFRILADSTFQTTHTLSVNSIGFTGEEGRIQEFNTDVTLNINGTDAPVDIGAETYLFGSVVATGGILLRGHTGQFSNFPAVLELENNSNNVSGFKIEYASLKYYSWEALGNSSIELGTEGTSGTIIFDNNNSSDGNNSNPITVAENGIGNMFISGSLSDASFGQLTLNNNSTLNAYASSNYYFSSVQLSGNTTVNTGLVATLHLNDIGENTPNSSLTCNSSGTTYLSGTGTFTGGMNIESGIVVQETAGAWGTGPIAVQSGAFLKQSASSSGPVPFITVAAFAAIGGNMNGFVYSGTGQNVMLADDAILCPDPGATVPVRGVDVNGAKYWLGITDPIGTYTVANSNGSGIYKGVAFGIFTPTTNGVTNFEGTMNEADAGQGIQVHTTNDLFLAEYIEFQPPTFNTTNTVTGVTFAMGPYSNSTVHIVNTPQGTARVYTFTTDGQDVTGNVSLENSHVVPSGYTLRVQNNVTLLSGPDAVDTGGQVIVERGGRLNGGMTTGTFAIKAGGALLVDQQQSAPTNGANFIFDTGSILQVTGALDTGSTTWVSPNSDVEITGGSAELDGSGLILGNGRTVTAMAGGTQTIYPGGGITIDPNAPSDGKISFTAPDGNLLDVLDQVTLGLGQTLQIGDTAPFGGIAGNSVQDGQVFLEGNVTVGKVVVTAGATLELRERNQSLSATSITVESNSTLQLSDLVGTTNAADGRIADSTELRLDGGNFSLFGANDEAMTETLGALVPLGGASRIFLEHGDNGTASLTFSGGLDATQRNGGTLVFGGSDLGLQNPDLGTANQIFLAGQPDGFIAPWAIVDNSGGNFGGDVNFAKYDSAQGVVPMSGADYTTDFTSSGHIRLSGIAGPLSQTLTADASIATLTLDSRNHSVSVNQAGYSIILNEGGLLSLGGEGHGTISGGTLTSGRADGELDVYTHFDNLHIDSQIINHGLTPLTLVKSGPGTLILGGTMPNTFTGTTFVDQGELDLNKTGTYALNGPVILAGGTLVQLQPNQFGPNVNLTVNSGSLSLQANSINSYTINDGSVASTDAWNVTSATLNGGSTTLADGSVWTIGSGVTPGIIHSLATTPVLVVNGGTTHIVAGSSTIVQGATTFSGINNPTIQIDAGSAPAAGLLKLQGDVNVIGTSGVAAITCPSISAGQTPGTVDLNGAMRTFTIVSGGTLLISARVTNGGITVSGSGTMQLMSANNYTGGTVLAGGTLLAGDPAALGSSSSPVTFSGGSLALRSGQATATFPQSLTTAPTGNTNVDLGPSAFTTGSAALGVALNVTGAAGSSWSLPSLALQNTTASPTAIHNAADVIVNGRVLMANGATNGDVLKDGAGTLTFAGTVANTYTGATTVADGVLVLNKSASVIAVPGDLTIIRGGAVRLNSSGQIASSSHVTLNNVPTGALLDLNGNTNTFNNGVNFIAGGTLSTGAGTATLGGNVQSTGTAGTAIIAGNLDLGSATRTFSVANGSAAVDMSVSANISGGPAAGMGLIKTGPGVLLLAGVNTYTGDTTVAEGTLQGTLPPNSALSIEDGASASVIDHGSGAKILLQLGGLSFLHNGTGRFDMANNDMIVRGAIAGDFSNHLKSGFNAHSGYWNGASGITSSSAAADTQYLMTLGYRQSDGNPFDGSMTSTNDVLISYTYFGDADLSGMLNGADYQQIDSGFGNSLTGWSNGDFNYDGIVNGSDFALIDNTFNQITGTGALATIAEPASLVAAPQDTSAIPEPATLGLIAIASLAVRGRRHRPRCARSDSSNRLS